MTAHERLRQLHTDATPGPWTWAGTYATLWLLPPGTPSPVPVDEAETWSVATIHGSNVETAIALATLRNALPQLANLAEAAAAVARRRGLTTAERYALISNLHDALVDLEQALNP